MNNILFQRATVFLDDRFLTNASVHIADGRIQTVSDQPVDAPGATVIDLADDYLVPGLIDLQLYGGSQLFLNEIPTPDTVRHIFDTHNRNGTTTLLPTIHSTSLDVMQQAMDAVQVVRAENPMGVPGIHIEGPYFNPIKRGAHSAAFVRVPDEAELNTLFSRNADIIRILTLAPEMLPPARLQQLFDLKHPNTRLSLGHSNATYRQATDALNTGQIPLATHLYNAMRGYESREPGVVGAIFDHPTVCTSLVADGYHCDPATIRIAHRLLGDRLFLISDALFAAPPGVDGPRPTFTLGEFVVHYATDPNGPGRYMNDEGKLAGSALTLIDCVRVCVEKAGLPLTDALRKATSIPADVAGLGDQIGRVQAGYAARLVRLDKALNVQAVWQ
ncbi:N-acetylglucosamine-6-phosphate deacetylase [Spirosoma rhododendri]|uniref:N-acetylglucosamine-6-phosphate deacetylase n=1 Tax=Spirosoma rhododendri TaxID=2728024 RepID=A0A7L5DNH7_9BACT|nr:N-acetylglucosamine-6-phosphate deacetylase [Spirosoma rhododendri]QJD79112.1 N-acetylglucosamine-6-phosphate deacetylase [Spirosoma rhododendri]